MNYNRKKITRDYKDLLADPASIFLGLTESNFYATKMEMKGSVRNPLTKNDLSVIKIISNKNFDYDIANNLLNTIIFNHNFNLTQPNYNLNNILDKECFSYIATKEGIFSVYIDSINKDLLIDTNNEAIKLFNNQIDKNNYKHQWKPMSFYDDRHKIMKQIEFLQYYLQDANTSWRHRRLLKKYIRRLNDNLYYENEKLMSNNNNPVVDNKNRNTIKYKANWNVDGYLKPLNWAEKINVNQKLLHDLEKDGILNKFIDSETIAKYRPSPEQIKIYEAMDNGTFQTSNEIVPVKKKKKKKNKKTSANNQILENERKPVEVGNRK